MTVRPYDVTHSTVAHCSARNTVTAVQSLRVITVALVMPPSVAPCLRAFIDSIDSAFDQRDGDTRGRAYVIL